MESFLHKKILIMGAGIRGKRVLRYLKNAGKDVYGFLDNNQDLWGGRINGVSCFKPDFFADNETDYVVLVSPEHSEKIEEELKNIYSCVIGEKITEQLMFLPESAGYKKILPIGHFYSLYPDVEEVLTKVDALYDEQKEMPGIDFNEKRQLDILEKMTDMYKTVPDWTTKGIYRARYGIENGNENFPPGDMIGLSAMLQVLRPKRLIEVGSGWSSAVSLDTNEYVLNNEMKLSFIEPYPEVLKSILKEQDHVDLRVNGLQDVELGVFASLNSGDVLFIDSTHVSKMGSDVNYLFFEILPRLQQGVYVHLHDIFYPFEYPLKWLTEEGKVWNELYLLRAFLQYNSEWEIIFFQNMMEKKHPELFLEKWPVKAPIHGGSFWMRKKK